MVRAKTEIVVRCEVNAEESEQDEVDVGTCTFCNIL